MRPFLLWQLKKFCIYIGPYELVFNDCDTVFVEEEEE